MIRLCQTNYVCIIKNYIYVNPSENGVVEEISLIDGEKSICVSKIKKIFILKHRKSLKKDGDDFSVFIVIGELYFQVQHPNKKRVHMNLLYN